MGGDYLYRNYEIFYGFNASAFFQNGLKAGIPANVLNQQIDEKIDKLWKNKKKENENDGFLEVDTSVILDIFI